MTPLDCEMWEKVSTEGMTPNARCRHAAVSNPFLADEEGEQEESSSGRVLVEVANNRKSLTKPTKSVSMCFGSATDSPAHVLPTKAIKYFKGLAKVYPSKVTVTSVSAQLDNSTSTFDPRTSAVSVRRSLREKIAHSKLVRSISGSSYNMISHGVGPAGAGTETLKDELERLVNVQPTPPMPRPSALSRLGHNLEDSSSSKEYHLRSKLQKSLSSDAVLESEGEGGTPVQGSSKVEYATVGPKGKGKVKARPKSELMAKSANSDSWGEDLDLMRVAEVPTAGDLLLLACEDVALDWPPPDSVPSKRHTVHESMSYYSLCFPSPPPGALSVSMSAGASPSTPGDQPTPPLPPPPPSHRLSYDGCPTLGSLADFEEEDGYQEDEMVCAQSPLKVNRRSAQVNFRLLNKENRRETVIVDLDEVTPDVHQCPPLTSVPRPRSHVFPSSLTLSTPGSEGPGLAHSVSHCSSGYHSFTDDTMYEKTGGEDSSLNVSSHNPFGSNSSNPAHPGVIFRRKNNRPPRNETGIELKNLGQHRTLHEPSVAESNGNGIVVGPSRPARARSWDRMSSRGSGPEVSKSAWQPAINAIKEVVVPASPQTRKWSAYSPSRTSARAHHWQLAMYVFGGREQGVSSVNKQPISVWKLYV